jgi:nucleoid-associated protein YgaU
MSALPVEQPPSGDHHRTKAATSARRARRATPVRQLFPNRNERLPDGDWTFPGGGERFSGDEGARAMSASRDAAPAVLALPPRPGATRPSVAELRLAAAADEAWLATVAKARFEPAPVPGRAPAPISASAPAPARPAVRLTRRGRIVLAVLAALVLAGLFVAGATAAQASAPAAAHAGDTRVFVQPGDTLWSIAQRTHPDADPQTVVQGILSDNHLSSAAVTVGQRLWVPRR